jgi:hypothetical protein
LEGSKSSFELDTATPAPFRVLPSRQPGVFIARRRREEARPANLVYSSFLAPASP